MGRDCVPRGHRGASGRNGGNLNGGDDKRWCCPAALRSFPRRRLGYHNSRPELRRDCSQRLERRPRCQRPRHPQHKPWSQPTNHNKIRQRRREVDRRARILPDLKRKLVVVGDGGCGKTCLLIVYAENRFPEAYIPTVFENYITQVKYEGKEIELALWDTAGQEEYDRLRPLSYTESHIILIVFSIDFPTSLANVQDKWYPEVAHFCEGTPLILVGTKTDLRRDEQTRRMLGAQGQVPVTSEQGAAVAREIGAKYVECSAKTGAGVQEVFNLALKESLKGKWGKIVKQRRCVVI